MTAEEFWPALSRGGRTEPMDRAECARLLAGKRVGRLAYALADGPQILPVNYGFTERIVVIRTLAYGEIAQHAPHRPVAFEVDETDELFRSGWSVSVRGTARPLGAEELRQLPAGAEPDSWAEGPRTLFLAIPADRLTGRRVLPSGA